MQRSLHIDPGKCTGCLQCEMACSYENEGVFNPAKSRIKVFTFHHEGRFVPYTCTQCDEAWCLKACPVNAIVINKVTGEVNRRDVSDKATAHAPERGTGGVREVEVEADRRQRTCLDDGQLAQLWKLGRDVERHYGCPQDIEWAVPRQSAGGEPVYLLQSRPETVWAKRDQAPRAAPAAKNYDHLVKLMSERSKKT